MTQEMPRSLDELLRLNADRSDPRQVAGTELSVIEVWRDQLRVLLETEQSTTEARAERLVSQTFEPFPKLWASFFFGNAPASSKWAIEELPELLDPSHPAVRLAFQLDVDQVFKPIAERTEQMLGIRPKGVWHVFFGPRNDLGGTSEGVMWANLRTIAKMSDPIEYIRFLLPHELSHMVHLQIMASLPPIEAMTLLHLVLMEGLCCYFNFEYWERKYSPARNTLFTDEDWQWCIEHELHIVRQAANDLRSSNWGTMNAYHRGDLRPWHEAPSRLAYFLGFRICECYVREHGPESWKQIYRQSAEETLLKSHYLERFGLTTQS